MSDIADSLHYSLMSRKITLLEQDKIRLVSDKVKLNKEVEKWKALAKEAVLDAPTIFLTSERKELREFAEHIIKVRK